MSFLSDNIAFVDKVLNFITRIRTWKQLFISLIFVIIIFFMVVVWYKWDDLFSVWKTTKIDIPALELEQTKKFESASIEQLRYIQLTTGADFSAIFAFRPKNINYFVDIVNYDGRLPLQIDPKNLGGYPIDKLSDEYAQHINGLIYISTAASPYLPTKEKVPVVYTYSCPYFNLDNFYSGSILMEWYKNKPEVSDVRLNITCNQAARTLGRIR